MPRFSCAAPSTCRAATCLRIPRTSSTTSRSGASRRCCSAASRACQWPTSSGVREFWSHEFAVSPATLVPRPETELLINLALCEIPRDEAWRVLDLGTGSGAIAVSLACERPQVQVTAVDDSAAALAVASENANALAPGNVECLLGDWTEPVRGRTFDLIVSNPPYVRADDEALDRLRHEPRSALVAGADGLDALRVLAADCPPLLGRGRAITRRARARPGRRRCRAARRERLDGLPVSHGPGRPATRDSRAQGCYIGHPFPKRAIMITIKTNHGDISIKLFDDEAPISSENFRQYCERRPFRRHRISPRHPEFHDPGRWHGREPDREADARTDQERGRQRRQQQSAARWPWLAPWSWTARHRSSS